MKFDYSEEQRMLADSLRRFVDTEYSFETRRKIARDCGSFDRRVWAMLASLGITALTVPADYDGFGEGAAGQLAVQRELGRGLVLEPVIPVAMATAILARHGSEDQRPQWLPEIARGERIVTLAYLEPETRYRTDTAKASAVRDGEGYRLDGVKALVWHGGNADAWLVSARLNGAISLFLVPREADGVTLASYPAMDGLHGADLHLRNVHLSAASLVGKPGGGVAALQDGIDVGIAAQCAAAAGAMERLIEITAEYLRTRKQFGRALATFQALQHRMAEMLVQKEMALSMAYLAAQAIDDQDADARRRKLAGAKVIVAQAGRFVGQQAVQLHGGMGVTDELQVGDYFKYLTTFDMLLGDSAHHMAAYSAAMAA
ncbi:L-prolyl-[peptidyl-carrier protein] dehydrogenase [Paraburkholderia caffeinitolerans]|uniref:L-prolyl-[peptidyl-carrier protein] dehydrogenase n=1 Tax=Paraburkholderia caffeinitolerans TaxID=1723730 RepID=A0A6J5G2E4_9BURK|nr:acyl-CoA dehydrogenase [Paraburkholderia caffeinitolerans]CAB3791000.1 L-prolyl-[peptidyl-carrier protein] dehydrogenase [Paraburkholderia caffeinitolerans]